MTNIGYKVIVSGRVQGVGFRYYTAQQADIFNLHGHAKNLRDGNVEVLIFGQQDKAQLLLTWLKEGPELARVTEIDIREIDYQASFVNFSTQ